METNINKKVIIRGDRSGVVLEHLYHRMAEK
jgi:hypothetical protein